MNVVDALRRAMASGNKAHMDAALLMTETALGGGGTQVIRTKDEGAQGHEVHIHVGGVGENAAGKEEADPKKEDPMDAAPEWFKADRAGRDSKFDAFCNELKDWRKGVDEFMKGSKDENPMHHPGGPMPMTLQDNKEIEGELGEEAPPGTALNDAKMAKDSALLVDSFQATCAGAEVLSPGIALPKLDRGAAPLATFNVICGLRRAALDAALSKPDTREVIMRANGGRTIDTAKAHCRDVRQLFNAAVAVKQTINASVQTEARGTADYGPVAGPTSLAELNATYAAMFAPQPRESGLNHGRR